MFRNLRFRWLALLLAVAGTSFAGPHGPAHELCERIIVEGGFVKSRGLLKYVALLGPEFTGDVARLGPKGVWADMGAGQAQAQREYKEWGGRARALAVSYDLLPSLEVSHPQMRILAGRFVEEIPHGELGRADLITDIYGALSYSPRIHRVLERYFKMLKPGGVIYMHSFEAHTSVIGPGGADLFLWQWLGTLPGVHVERVWRMVDFGETFRVTLDRPDPLVPTLILREASEGWPPRRVFAEIEH